MQTPAPPANGVAAAAWVRDKKIIAPDFLSFEARLQQEKAELGKAVPAPGAGADSPAVLDAVRGYEAYRAQNSGDKEPTQVLGRRTNWIVGRFNDVRKRLGDEKVGDHNAVDDELKAWTGLFGNWQSTRRPLVDKAQKELAAAGDLAMIHDPKNVAAIKAYKTAMLVEVETQLSITRLAVQRLMELQ